MDKLHAPLLHDMLPKAGKEPAENKEYEEAIDAYGKIRAATKIMDAQAHREALLEGGQAFSSDSFGIARTLLRAGDERPKPNGDRLREFSDSEKASLELSLFSEKPIYTDFEILKLTDCLTFLAPNWAQAIRSCKKSSPANPRTTAPWN